MTLNGVEQPVKGCERLAASLATYPVTNRRKGNVKEKEYFKVVTRDGMYYSDVGEVYHDTLEKTLAIRTEVGTRVFNFLEVKYYDTVSLDKYEQYMTAGGEDARN